ncbi:MAG: NAD(P)H-quinone oxidoreductase [Rhodospirillaceae bacterium]|jgi:NADPH2:quinone reductase|nr:NAD(P)H-quinone oxidoreductase [Rhodospirillaceae bacterium]
MKLPIQMKCVEVVKDGSSEALKITERITPKPKNNEVLIHVVAAGVNRADIFQRIGKYSPPLGSSNLLGLEVAGTIVDVGPSVSKLRIGKSVCALVTGGGYAQFCTAVDKLCMPFPKNYKAVQAAALPETLFTVWYNVFKCGHLKNGESFLVHGGSSGIGTIAIQLAKVFGATVYATAGGVDKCQVCLDLGATLAINYKNENFVDIIDIATKGRGVDLILDMIGGDYLNRNIKSLAVDGRHVSIAFLKSNKAEVNFLPVMLKHLTLTGSTLRSRTVDEKFSIVRALRTKVWPLLDEGRITPIISATFPLSQAADAHKLMESNTHIGKIILTL